jgi:hypothetical protein
VQVVAEGHEPLVDIRRRAGGRHPGGVEGGPRRGDEVVKVAMADEDVAHDDRVGTIDRSHDGTSGTGGSPRETIGAAGHDRADTIDFPPVAALSTRGHVATFATSDRREAVRV